MFRVDGPLAVAAGRFRFMGPFVACDRPGAGRPVRQLIGLALPIEGAVTHALIPKHPDHCPPYRESAVCARSGLDPDRPTPAGWAGGAAFRSRPVADQPAEHPNAPPKPFIGGTREPVPVRAAAGTKPAGYGPWPGTVASGRARIRRCIVGNSH